MASMLDLHIPLRVKGRAAKKPAVSMIRELTDADLALLQTERAVKPTLIKRVRDSHHALARALASGVHEAEAALIAGYCLSRISVLKNDPTFIELIEFYRREGAAKHGDFAERMIQMARMAQEELQDRLEDNPAQFEIDDLRKIMTDSADRAGYSPKSGKTVTVNLNFAGRLERARQRMLNHDGVEAIDAVVVEGSGTVGPLGGAVVFGPLEPVDE